MNCADTVFGAHGLLSKVVPGYRPRPGQLQMVTAVEQALASGRHLVVEGPTGTGKSLAYLVPLIERAVSNSGDFKSKDDGGRSKRVVVCTANIALQEQLVEKDLPMLQRLLPQSFDFALRKGRSNYVCLRRLYEGTFPVHPHVDTVLEWANRTRTGDRSELKVEPDRQVWAAFSSGSDSCHGQDCAYNRDCWFTRAKKVCQRSHVIVTNYHVLYLDLRYGNILPPYFALAMDEAHKAADIARDVFGWQLGLRALQNLGQPLTRLGLSTLPSQVSTLGSQFFADLELERLQSERRMPSFEHVRWQDLAGTLAKLSLASLDASEGLQKESELKAKLVQASKKAAEWRTRIQEAMTDDSSGYAYYLEDDHGTKLCGKPVRVGRLLQPLYQATTIITSATLSTYGKFDYIVSELGVPEERIELEVESPFDYQRQALLIVPAGLPDPKGDQFAANVASTVAEVVRLARGRTLGLFTSYRVMELAYQRLQSCGYPVLKQGDRPRTQLIQEFRDTRDSVLLGTESFWAGVDVPGESLSAVVIDRLPFPTPQDPILKALEAMGEKSFFMYSIPRACIAFKQGFGRLIRSTSDRGVVVLLDPRIDHRTYGRHFAASLPKGLRRSNRLSDILTVLG